MLVRALAFITAFLLTSIISPTVQAIETDKIPPALEQWESWVLDGEEIHFCPSSYNNGEGYRCIWPSRLNLELEPTGGSFTQNWLVFKKGLIPLLGGAKQWPYYVTLDGKEVPVIAKNGLPSVYMKKGEHLVKGRFIWDEMPEIIHLPEACGLVSLSINGKSMDFPMLEKDGRLWLQKQKKTDIQEEDLRIRIFRLLNDTIPMQVTNLIKINVSGKAREIEIEPTLFKDFVPMSIKSRLPARLGANGTLMIQARPGRWEIQVITRSKGPVSEIDTVKAPYGQEIWSFQSRNQLRLVKILGVTPIDPNQTDIPNRWKTFPTFIINAGDKLTFKEIRRGNPDPAPDQLRLDRTWWLDFDGKGFTIKDHITGTMSSQWYLAMNHPTTLGRISVDGVDQLITSHGKDKKPGVELRKGRLNLIAESRLTASIKTLPGVGWNHDFESLKGMLNLPPGWRLLTVRGVDVMPGAWFENWTLLDLFLVLIISLAVLKLQNWRWGLIALLTVGLTYHEPGSPRIVWLNLLAASALLRLIPEGWVKKLTEIWRLASIVTLLVLAIPFMVQQIRYGVYPQLELPKQVYPISKMDKDEVTSQADFKRAGQKALRNRKTHYKSGAIVQSLQLPETKGYLERYDLFAQDPKALIQTGPGLPKWRWRSYAMKWNGPVNKDQEVRLWLLSPLINLILAITRVILLALLIYCLIGLRRLKIPAKDFAFTALLLSIFIFPGFAAGGEVTAGYPPPELLKELKMKLLKKPACLPECAESPRMEITVSLESLRIIYQIHAEVDTAVPLPGSSELWRPKDVFNGSRPLKGLMRDSDGSLWIFVPEGIHTITLMGNAPSENSFQIPLPLKPHRVVIQSQGWDVQGVDKDGRVGSSIKLVRKEENNAKKQDKSTIALLPFLHIERNLCLGLDWQVHTTVRRLTPVGAPVVISVPLIPGESITKAGILVEKGKALIHMKPNERQVSWNSTLKQENTIKLQAPQSVPWTETWLLDISPVWHCVFTGIPIILHQDESGRRRPKWRPWPGEEVEINVFRPKAIPGQVVTIDDAKLTCIPGRRFNKVDLSLNIRASQGGQHKITLPDGSKLQQVKIMGKEQPLKKMGNKVIIPIRPGKQNINVIWHQGAGSSILIKAPRVDIGKDAVNADVIFKMPENRWILFTAGPRLGPAVLFWSYIIVIILVAIGLGRIPWTPLKTRHWLLIGLGLTQVHPIAAIMICGWLLALGLRKKYQPQGGWFYFNVQQIILALWTIAALTGLYFSIQKGLLGIPDMQIAGNGSSEFLLHWTKDRIGSTMPQPSVLSLPLFVYRILMLLWALWLAHSLLKWLRWGWDCFVEGGLWRKIVLHRGREKARKNLEEEEEKTPA